MVVEAPPSRSVRRSSVRRTSYILREEPSNAKVLQFVSMAGNRDVRWVPRSATEREVEPQPWGYVKKIRGPFGSNAATMEPPRATNEGVAVGLARSMRTISV